MMFFRSSFRAFLASTLLLIVVAPALGAGAQTSSPSAAAASDGATATAPGGRTLLTLDPRLFPLAPELRDNADFWTKVYTRYPSHTVLIHDDRHLHVVYAALDFSKLKASNISERRRRQLRREEIRKAKGKYEDILEALAAGRTSRWPRDQERIAALFDSVPGNRSKYREAVDRMRSQTCLADRFADGLQRSGLYLPAFEQIFVAYDLPIELTRIPFVESLFQESARSKVAAGGVWQFMPGTAKSYLRMSPEVDERFDPLRAADAAARLLRTNYEALRTWPLAITAYNHGRGGMKRAVRQVGTRDLGEIAQRYRSRTFGFASRNFYSEFVAAAEIYLNRDHYFPQVVPFGPLTYDEFIPEHYVSVPSLARAAQVDLDDIKALNPGLSSQIWSANLYLPKGYSIRVPQGSLVDVQQAYEGLDDRSSRQIGTTYRVRPGDTLGRIAARHGTSARAIQRANGLRSANRIRIGQVLRIPGGGGGGGGGSVVAASTGARPSRAASANYTVRRGDTLSKIAARHGSTVRAIQRANGLSNANALRVGQRLTIPSGDAIQHTVRRGETLASIAQRYGTSVAAIQRANRITSHIIRPSQVLIIP